MKYNSEEMVSTTRIEPGIHEFTVVNAQETQSKAGNDMISLELQVGDEGATVFDNLVSTPKALWKIEQFCKCVGLDFSRNELNETDCIGMAGKADFYLGEPKQNGKQYIEVAEYLPPTGYTEQPATGPATGPATKSKPVQETVAPSIDDDIPF